jgi:hypothetical protein
MTCIQHPFHDAGSDQDKSDHVSTSVGIQKIHCDLCRSDYIGIPTAREMERESQS